MIEIQKVFKANGELVQTRVQAFRVDTLDEMERKRIKLEAHYNTGIIFAFKDLREKHVIPQGHHNKERY